ncbi:MAG: efflux RND transporter periplasmic adaptor subunit [Bacteroidetes bacterium]|nr:efflux RND transporter periplasmic adaptor subunit [Bacteroidota bacterium]
MKQVHILCFFSLLLLSCGSGKGSDEAVIADVQTPVTVTSISTDTLAEYVDLNATATFLQKSYVKANINGYVQNVSTEIGKYVHEGQQLFALKTKEAQAIGSDVNKLDPTFKFSGINYIKASSHGYVNQLNHQVGDYVQDGEQLAVINDMNSFAFVLDLPYELRRYVMDKKSVTLILPDGTRVEGTVASTMPAVDPAAQTQRLVVKVPNSETIPENLIAKVRIVKMEHANVPSLPKAAVLTNDVQSEFWVMKMADSTTAVKVVIRKGMETPERVEIVSPAFSKDDKFLITGNFGLPDTAKVKIVQQ